MNYISSQREKRMPLRLREHGLLDTTEEALP